MDVCDGGLTPKEQKAHDALSEKLTRAFRRDQDRRLPRKNRAEGATPEGSLIAGGEIKRRPGGTREPM